MKPKPMKISLPTPRVHLPCARPLPQSPIHNRQSAIANPQSFAAFTLIELLVVIGIIAILSALIAGTFGYAMSRARRERVETERETLVAAIQSYKADKGFYPPDNTSNPALPPLFYEITGTTITATNASGPASYFATASGDNLTFAQVTSVFGLGSSGTGGFANASTDATQVKNYLGAAAKSARTGKIPIIVGGVTVPVTVFGVSVLGPVQLQVVGGGSINPWSYVSTNPTNNSTTYDLWMDVYLSGKTNRFSNWSREPQIQ
jgi:prepilin-type N-terminal cleavage/methylation domain-containing protein